jgi:hypothetical protein
LSSVASRARGTRGPNRRPDVTLFESTDSLDGRDRRSLVSPLPYRPVKERIMTVKITPNDKGNPPGKLAEAEVHFEDGYFQGLKLVGFAIWERRSGNGRNVTFPARSYSVNGERRSFALLRPITDSTAQDRVRDLILQAYREHEEQLAVAE